ncbi:hypothetical protein EW026_g7089 [Hermanssonia centrifuga]|uniref:Nephrocystin 3-like N-terminal domain-containing protein n=1 Tax=Hermanssonia centrifuga TaxID=98765 RepID=A0A4S4K8X3_9APHY|nr:hypothetical protein EW026_g7089 [Hermanssonia centrifuga]
MPSSPDAQHCITRELVYRPGKRFKLDLCVKVDAPDPLPPVPVKVTQELHHGLINGQSVDGEIERTEIAIAQMSTPRVVESLTRGIDAGSAVVTQVHTIETTLKPVLDKLEVFCDIMDNVAEVHPYAKMAWTILKGVYTVVQNQFDRDQKILGLFAQMKSLYEIVDDLQRQLDDIANPGIKSPKELLRCISIQTLDCCFFVRSYGSLSFVQRTMKGILSNVDKRITEYRIAFESLKQEFYDKLHVDTHVVVVDTQLIVSRVLQVVEGAGEKAILSDMPYKEGSSLGDKRKQCLPGTRTGILDGMSVWVNADTSEDGHQSICVLAGPAGTGKSAIAHSMTAYFKTLHRLAASFGFKRAPGSDGLTKLFPTIAQNMADFDEDIRKALCAAVGGDKALRMTHDLEEQFDNFILAPLKKIVFSGPVLIVIDALDECGSSSEQEELAGLLARRAKDFPPNLRIVITCRPELHIIQRFKEEASHVVIRDMENVDSTSQDIRSYVHFRLIDDCRPKLAGIDERDCTELAEASQGLFQWASVACAQIVTRTAGLTPLEIHKRLVESTSGVDQVNLLDALYKEVLKRFFDMNDETVKDRFRTVLGMIFGSFEPLSMVGLVAMCQDYCDVTLVLDFLGSLLSVPPNISHDPVRPIHTSFRDFLLDPDRSGDFFVDSSDAHQRLALASLRVMNRELVFNICALKSSWERNDEVSDLAYRIKKHIPHHLLYSCRFWAQHLQTPDSQFEQLFNTFILGKLLFFLEVTKPYW